jgi:CHAT domain-containing protein
VAAGTSRFLPIPGTAQEVTAVHRLLPGSLLWTGSAASEAALKRVQGPWFVHIGTHGFFLDDPAPPAPTTRGLTLLHTPHPAVVNPLLRAGLALAGANDPPQPGMEDGLLTALEVAHLDLWGTALVVLSACDTGMGQVHNGEGVYGLRRALVMAGAASHYQRLLAGEGRAEALRQVQLTMLADPQRQHPFYWAAFLLSGAWTPLATHGPGWTTADSSDSLESLAAPVFLLALFLVTGCKASQRAGLYAIFSTRRSSV